MADQAAEQPLQAESKQGSSDEVSQSAAAFSTASSQPIPLAPSVEVPTAVETTEPKDVPMADGMEYLAAVIHSFAETFFCSLLQQIKLTWSLPPRSRQHPRKRRPHQ